MMKIDFNGSENVVNIASQGRINIEMFIAKNLQTYLSKVNLKKNNEKLIAFEVILSERTKIKQLNINIKL